MSSCMSASEFESTSIAHVLIEVNMEVNMHL
jgi:hypothetical protein